MWLGSDTDAQSSVSYGLGQILSISERWFPSMPWNWGTSLIVTVTPLPPCRVNWRCHTCTESWQPVLPLEVKPFLRLLVSFPILLRTSLSICPGLCQVTQAWYCWKKACPVWLNNETIITWFWCQIHSFERWMGRSPFCKWVITTLLFQGLCLRLRIFKEYWVPPRTTRNAS